MRKGGLEFVQDGGAQLRTGRIHRFVRSHVAALDEDRSTGVDFERLAGAVQEGELRGVLADAGGRP